MDEGGTVFKDFGEVFRDPASGERGFDEDDEDERREES